MQLSWPVVKGRLAEETTDSETDRDSGYSSVCVGVECTLGHMQPAVMVTLVHIPLFFVLPLLGRRAAWHVVLPRLLGVLDGAQCTPRPAKEKWRLASHSLRARASSKGSTCKVALGELK